MNPKQATRLTRVVRTLGLLAAVAGLVSTVGTLDLRAQNAAQRAALAQMGRAKAHAQSNASSGSTVEATNVQLDQPGGLAFDMAGNLYIADTDNNIVREVSLAGLVSTVAGDGEQGFGGDGGPATAALLDSPAGVAVDAEGNIFIGDTHNNRVREVLAPGGNITTIAGTGVAGFSGDGAAAASAMLNLPTAVAVDSKGNLYIADTNNNRIREISGTTIGTVAGDGDQTFSGDGGLATAAGLDSPNGIAVDAAFNLYIGDTHNQRVRMVTYSTGIITTLAGTGVKGFNADGAAGSAELARPRGVAVDATGSVYVADSDNNRIRNISGGTVATVAGSGEEGHSGDSGSSTSASLDLPRGVATQASSIAFSDTENNSVQTIIGGTVNTIAGETPVQNESLAIGGPSTVLYGTGTLTATFANGSNTGTGKVTFYDGRGASPALAGTASLSGNAAVLSTSLFSAGIHSIVASYAGDANNAPINSGVYVLTVTPRPLTAVAETVNLLYGQTIPTLTGTLNGSLPQDAGNIAAAFSTSATIISDPGTFPIAVALTGGAAGNYTVALGSGAGSLVIAQAPAQTTLTAGSGTSILGTSLTLTATVASTTSGIPGGTVNFYDGTTLLNSSPSAVSSGTATLVTTALPAGTQSITAVYSGNTDFTSSTSSALAESVLSPEFAIAASPASQSVLPSKSAQYTITLTPVNPAFVYPVSLSVSGLPAGVTAAFAPASVAIGAGTSTSVLTLSAGASAGLRRSGWPFGGVVASTSLAFLVLPLFFSGRFRRVSKRLARAGKLAIAVFALAALVTLAGCGGGGFFNHGNQTSTVTVTAISGPNTHTTSVTLTVQ